MPDGIDPRILESLQQELIDAQAAAVPDFGRVRPAAGRSFTPIKEFLSQYARHGIRPRGAEEYARAALSQPPEVQEAIKSHFNSMPAGSFGRSVFQAMNAQPFKSVQEVQAHLGSPDLSARFAMSSPEVRQATLDSFPQTPEPVAESGLQRARYARDHDGSQARRRATNQHNQSIVNQLIGPGSPAFPPQNVESEMLSALNAFPESAAAAAEAPPVSPEERAIERLAPTNRLHDQSHDLIQQSIARGNDANKSNLPHSRVSEAAKINLPEHLSVIDRENNVPLEAFMAHHTKNTSEPYLRALERRMEQDFLKKTVPGINGRFVQNGNFFSGARQSALKDAEENVKLNRDILLNKTREDERNRLMNQYGEQAQRNLQNKGIEGDFAHRQQGQFLKEAEILANEDSRNRQMKMEEGRVVNQLANQEQKQKQAALNLIHETAHIEQQRPLQNFHQRAALASMSGANAIPYPSYNTYAPNPHTPDPLTAGLGGLFQTAALNAEPQKRARGGSVRGRFAKGGAIKSALSEMKELNRHSDAEQNPYAQEMMMEANNLRNDQTDPRGRYLFQLGTHMLGNLRDPMKGYTEGSLKGMDAYDAAHAGNRANRKDANALMQKINESKLYQQEVFQKYYQKKREDEGLESYRKGTLDNDRASLDETKRHNNMTHKTKMMELGESKRHHDMEYSNSMGMTKEEAKLRAKESSTIMQDIAKASKAADKIIKRTTGLEKTIQKTNTGSITGGLGKLPYVGPYLQKIGGAGSPSDLGALRGEGNELAIDTLASMGGKGTVAALNAIQNTKPNEFETKDENLRRVQSIKEGALEIKAKTQFIRKFVKEGRGDAVDAQAAYDERQLEKEAPEMEGGSDSAWVWVENPDTGERMEIPESDLKDAEKDGFVKAKK